MALRNTSADRAGTTALITGGARGFGRAFGAALVAEGATVVLIDLDADAVAQTAAELGASGGHVIGLAADVTDEKRIDEVIAEAARPHGGIDLLINNAGLHAHAYSRPLVEMGVAKTRRLFEVNVMGTVICTLAARPLMAGRKGASVINIASSAAFQGGGYGNSKLAVIGITMTFARELAPEGIRVNAIAPGIILTDTIRTELPADTIQRVLGMQYLSEEGTEQDIVDAMLFLTSSRARFITGETLRVTGGYAAGV
jgi:3-oxoacyl-[acyl-carrier protein] reductase